MPSQSASVRAIREAPGTPPPPNVIAFFELKTHCASCSMRELCLPVGLESDAMGRLDEVISSRTRVKKRASLYRPGGRFTALYAIRLGTFKTLVLAEDGREQIVGYHMAGEIIGLDGIGDDRYACQAIALEDSEVCVLPFHQLDQLALDVPTLRRNLYRLISRDLCRDQEMMLLLGSRCAEERLALFLLNLAQRYRARGYSASEFVLRMTREEIASYLGLKLETVSRLFSSLQEQGLIQVQGRAIKLLDSAALKQLIGRPC
jgi:CRP/FNR family transcriptional regulator, anaerobic regulatory protein